MARINDAIREPEVRLIANDGDHVGVVSIQDALQRAQDAGLDLVEVGNKSKPHVCRIMDYGQYKYELAKKQKEARKKQAKIVVKEIKLRPRIDQHDYQFKLNNAVRFLEHGDKVRFILQFRGREMAHKELGMDVLQRVIADLEEHATVEQSPRQEGRFMNMTLTPVPQKVKKTKSKDDEDSDSTTDEQPITDTPKSDGDSE